MSDGWVDKRCAGKTCTCGVGPWITKGPRPPGFLGGECQSCGGTDTSFALPAIVIDDVLPGAVAESRTNPSRRCVVRLVGNGYHGVHYLPLSDKDRRHFAGGAYCGPGATERFLRDWKVVGRRTVGGVLAELERAYRDLARERARRPRPDMTFPC